ncbi:ATP-binding cassette, subfamily B/ATP-binding cassette, subfamily B, MsbA [Faecalicatena contorta]|uniref:ATP-binding cassette, subfamily B/ATP-binding cassette, subfamily B, MsbA n=2 Tax=Faecalicatena contorta TaxID=39482 RepID=A0A315ZRC4_9FIRM|nr:ATP-binding cassette subfamily B protein [Faecalicatena contorta]SUQ15638.1 ATP-binding cassette, subfamily B/ATP-binding cassette, subfamily B, MsbA [Faecalicatena contorta]
MVVLVTSDKRLHRIVIFIWKIVGKKGKDEIGMIKIKKQIFCFVKKKKILFILTIFLSVIGVVFSYLQPVFSQKLIDNGLVKGIYSNVIYYTILILGTIIFQQISEIIQTRNYARLKNDFVEYLYGKAFEKIVILNVNYFDQTNSTSLSNVLTLDINNISMLFDSGTLVVINYGIITIGAIIGLAHINLYLTFLVLLFLPIKLAFTILFSKKIEKINNNLIHESQKFYEWWGETIDGLKEIKLWNLFNKKNIFLKGKQHDILELRYKASMIDCYNTTFDNILEWIIRTLIYGIAGYLVCQRKMTVGVLLAFITYTEYIIRPISTVLYVKFIIARIKPSLKHFSLFLDSPEEVDSGVLKVDKFKKLEFKNVSFSYRDKDLLKNINLVLHAGEKIAIIGENGSGKTTLANIILRFIVPDSGELCLNEQNVLDYNMIEYRNVFSVCSQSIFLFKNSLRYNLDLKEELSDDQIIKYDEGFWGVTKELLNKQLNNNAKNLSGGERQRIALSRALCKNSEVFIFDESDSNLDQNSAYKLEEIINKLDHKAVILITHRKTNFDNMDSVYLLKQGVLKKIK